MQDSNIIILGIILLFAMASFIFEWMQIEVLDNQGNIIHRWV
mgnify:CR=1 FL=1